ncbi:hypothetical protein, partial [Methylicorpusculum sp.]|uniref:hypothetical protein n=1 Tax=Methylicorpusculum sp. TaxID=2713644 RepID=UPI002ABC292B
MIQYENISKEHYINSIKPFMLIKLPFLEDEVINEEEVTCFFSIMYEPLKLKCIGIEYFPSIDNKILLNTKFGEHIPNYVYVF